MKHTAVLRPGWEAATLGLPWFWPQLVLSLQRVLQSLATKADSECFRPKATKKHDRVNRRVVAR